MSSRGRSGANGRGSRGAGGSATTVSSSIPEASRKMVQSMKEIVNNHPDNEIYAMLKECGMDPNEAIDRLLSQDPFHEVKSKREKKKENKDMSDSRPRGSNNTSSRGNRGGMDRGRGAPNQYNSFDSGNPVGRSSYKKENGQSSYSSSYSASSMTGNNLRQPPVTSDPIQEYKISATGDGSGTSLSSQPSSGVQSAWLGIPGQVSMADIVKKGRPHSNASSQPNRSYVNDHHVMAPSLAPHYDFHQSQDHASKVSEHFSEPGDTYVPSNDEWPSVEQQSSASASVFERATNTDMYGESSGFTIQRTSQQEKPQMDDTQLSEDDAESIHVNHVGPTPTSSLNIHDDDDLYENKNSYEPQRNTFETQEEDSIAPASSVAENFQQLNLIDDQYAEPDEESCPVKIPNHLQVQTEQFSHLSFGSFGPSISAGVSGQVASQTAQNEEHTSAADASSVGHTDTRNYDYYGDEHLRNASDGSLTHRSGAAAGDYDSPSISQPESLKQESSEAIEANQYTYPSSGSGYNFESAEHMNPAFANPQPSSQMPNHASLSNVYTNSLPSTLLATNVQPVRESDLSYSPFPVAQSMPPKYSNTMSSISGPTISMPEALRAGNFSSPQPTAQNMPGTSVATGPALPQQLAVHPYSQPTLPLGHFANMIGYPFLPQSYTYLPSAFQQAYTGSSYHQSLAAVLPQYKNSVSVSSLPQSAAVASGYGAFGNSSSIPGNFSLNPPAAPTGTTLGYDDIISSHYKDGNPMVSVQQNENSGTWLHGLGSRTMSAVPASTYYNYQGQSQQPAGFRQGQQPTQHAGPLGYPNYYHSQGGISLEQQNPRDGPLGGGSQTQQQSKQSQQIWQNSY